MQALDGRLLKSEALPARLEDMKAKIKGELNLILSVSLVNFDNTIQSSSSSKTLAENILRKSKLCVVRHITDSFKVSKWHMPEATTRRLKSEVAE